MVNLKTILVMVVIVAIATTAVTPKKKAKDGCTKDSQCTGKDANKCAANKCVQCKVDKDCTGRYADKCAANKCV